MKNSYRDKIVAMRRDFESMVATEYPSLVTKQKINSKEEPDKRNTCRSRTSIKLKELSDTDITTEPFDDD